MMTQARDLGRFLQPPMPTETARVALAHRKYELDAAETRQKMAARARDDE
jgi:hypothetical protein